MEKKKNKEIEELAGYYEVKKTYSSKSAEDLRPDTEEKQKWDRAEEPEKIDYTSYYDEESEDEEDTVDTNPEVTEMIQIQEEGKGKDPELISPEEAENRPNLMTLESFFYYILDDTLIDDNGNVVDDYKPLLGNTLVDSGITEQEEDFEDGGVFLYIMNYQTMTMYEVYCIYGSVPDKEEES